MIASKKHSWDLKFLSTNSNMITLQEKTALLRSKNPRRSNWFVTFEWDEWNQHYVAGKRIIDSDWDVDIDFVCFTQDERAKHCWFTDYNHMLIVDDLYNEAKREKMLQTN